MKRYIPILLSLCLLAGCGERAGLEPAPTETPAVETTPAPETAAVPEPAPTVTPTPSPPPGGPPWRNCWSPSPGRT